MLTFCYSLVKKTKKIRKYDKWVVYIFLIFFVLETALKFHIYKTIFAKLFGDGSIVNFVSPLTKGQCYGRSQ